MRSWVSFPTSTNLIPFDFSIKKHELNEETRINLLVETEILPESKNSENLSIEDFGELLAWKVDTHFAVLLKSDLLHFTELIMSSFMRDSFAINDGLPLIRVECKFFFNFFKISPRANHYKDLMKRKKKLMRMRETFHVSFQFFFSSFF